MHIEKLKVNTTAAIPLMAALPYGVTVEDGLEEGFAYDPETQITHFAGRGFSTCRNDESAGNIFQSKSDTSKDD